MADGTPLRKFYYEVGLVADGVEPGSAQAQAAFKEIEDAAARAGLRVEAITSKLDAAATTVGAAASAQAETLNTVGESADAAASKVDGLRAAQERWLAEAQAGRGTSGKAFEVDLSKITNDPFAGLEKSAKQSGRQVADQLLAGVKEEYAAHRLELQQQLSAGLINPAQFKTQLKGLMTARNDAILSVVDQAAKAGTLGGPQGGAVLVALTSQLKDVDQAATRAAAGGIRTMAREAATMATQVIGAKSSVGQFAAQLGILGAGAGVALAVTAAIAAIGFAYTVLTEKATQAAAKVKAVVDQLVAQAEAQKTIDDRAKERSKAIAADANPGFSFTELAKSTILGLVGGETLQRARANTLSQDQSERTAAATAASDAETRKEKLEALDKEAASLAAILAANKAGSAEQQRINALTASYRAELKALTPQLSSASDEVRRAALSRKTEILSILDAFQKPAETAGAAAEKLAAAQKTALGAFDSAIASQTVGAADNLDAQIAKLVADAEKAKVASDVIAQKVQALRTAATARLKQESQQLAADMQRELVATTGSQSLALEQGLKDFQNNVAIKRSQGLTIDDTTVAAITAAKEQAIDWAKQAEKLSLLYADIDQDLVLGGNLIGDMAKLNDQLASAEADRDAARARINAGDLTAYAAYNNAQQRINALTGEQGKLQQRNQKLLDDAAKRSQTLAASLASTASGIADAANAAFGLASALGGADSAAARLFGSIGQVAGGISNVASLADKAGGFGSLFSTGAGLASALPGLGQAIGGAIALGSSLFSESPQQLAAIETQKENTQALKVLTDRVGDLAKVNVTGRTQTSISSALSSPAIMNALRALGVNPAAGDFTAASAAGLVTQWSKQFGNDLNAALKAAGLSFQDLQEFAKQYGITIADSGATVQNVADVMKAISTSELTTFGDDFEGQTAKFNAAVKLLDLTTPAQQFAELTKDLSSVKGGAGAFGDLLKTFDLSTAEGVQKANDALATFFRNMSTLTPDQLGGLTAQNLLDAQTSVKSILDSAAQAAGTGGFNVDRSITEVTGSRMAALLSTANVFAERSAIANESIFALLSGGVVPTIKPPTLPAGASFTSGATGGISVAMGNVNVTVQIGSGFDAATAQRIGDQTAQAISRAIQDQINWTNRANGSQQMEQ